MNSALSTNFLEKKKCTLQIMFIILSCCSKNNFMERGKSRNQPSWLGNAMIQGGFLFFPFSAASKMSTASMNYLHEEKINFTEL